MVSSEKQCSSCSLRFWSSLGTVARGGVAARPALHPTWIISACNRLRATGLIHPMGKHRIIWLAVGRRIRSWQVMSCKSQLCKCFNLFLFTRNRPDLAAPNKSSVSLLLPLANALLIGLLWVHGVVILSKFYKLNLKSCWQRQNLYCKCMCVNAKVKCMMQPAVSQMTAVEVYFTLLISCCRTKNWHLPSF